MGPLAKGLFGAFWTAGVTVGSVILAKATARGHYIISGQRLWAKGLLRAWGVELDVYGAERLRPGTLCIVMANHASYADVPILMAGLPFVPGFLAKRELAKIPFLAMALRVGRHVLIDRADRGSALRAVKMAATEVREGKTIAIFPEGTRGDGVSLGELKRGGFLIAKRALVPVFPVRIRGSHAILPRGATLPHGGRVSVHVGEPILPEQIQALSAEELAELVRKALEELGPGPAPREILAGAAA